MDDLDVQGLETTPLIVGKAVPRKTLIQVFLEAKPRIPRTEPLTIEDLVAILTEVWNTPPHPAEQARKN